VNLDISGKTALVLGGGGGLGRAICKALATESSNVAVADIDPAALAETESEVRALGVGTIGVAWDRADLTRIDPNITKIENELGPVDILVSLTGGPPPTPASGQDPALWSRYFQSMVLSIIAVTDRVLPQMKKKKWGRIITSTSSGVVAPIPELAISNALRLSLVGWSKTLAREVAREGITANIIMPGRIATNRIRFLDEAKAQREGRSIQEVAAASACSIPMGRYGRPEEYADAIAFLASERASYITGSSIRVDGGLIASL
jgi:3-oxoacyl-[acyl-carrier protein] reductase